MKQMKQQFVDSWHELRHLKTVVVTAMLIAVGIILGYFSITVTPVSYTHLDVYKRQVHRSEVWAGILEEYPG